MIFDKARSGKAATAEEREKFSFYLMVFFGQLDAAKGWTKQLHLGAFRNCNSRMFARLGPDTGSDTIGDTEQGAPLVNYLDTLASAGSLPKIVLYNLNPRDNYLFACLTGAFQDGTVAGKPGDRDGNHSCPVPRMGLFPVRADPSTGQPRFRHRPSS